MAELNETQIDTLVDKAQTGEGCALQDQFVNLNLNEQIRALHDMREAYARQTATDVETNKLSLTALQLTSKTIGDSLELSVGYNKRPASFKESVNLDTAKVEYSCQDSK